jgi:hypothetical protein
MSTSPTSCSVRGKWLARKTLAFSRFGSVCFAQFKVDVVLRSKVFLHANDYIRFIGLG